MAYKRKTKDVVCRKCGKQNTVPVDSPLKHVCCTRRDKDGYRCLGDFRLVK